MTNKVSISKLVSIIAFVFVFIFGIMSTSAWLKDYDDEDTKAGFVVTIGQVQATIEGNSEIGGATNVDLIENRFALPSMLNPSMTFNQTINVKTEEEGIYVRIKFVVVYNGTVNTDNYITPSVDTTEWTKTSEWYEYNGTVPEEGALFCEKMTVDSNIPSGGVFQVIIVLEAASTAFTA